jgi:hypothetical protein
MEYDMDIPVPPHKQIVHVRLANGAWRHFEIVDDGAVEFDVVKLNIYSPPSVRTGQSEAQLVKDMSEKLGEDGMTART